MREKRYYAIFSTAAGRVGVLGSGNGLCRATLPQKTERAAFRALGEDLKDAVNTPERFKDIIERYRTYFAGRRMDFPDKLDLTDATPFQQAVWQAVRLIPYGETRSYSWVAAAAGKTRAARAAGQALARNPLPIIVPCHRVVAGDGGPGGFSGGFKMKRFLLRLEAKTSMNDLQGIIGHPIYQHDIFWQAAFF
jgi:methylated-DNA-[protein]-cysteine S-methyltransferase